MILLVLLILPCFTKATIPDAYVDEPSVPNAAQYQDAPK